MEYKLMRYGGSNCHVFTFDPKADLRFDATIGVPGKLEPLSKIKGEPAADEEVVAKLNGGFFDMRGSTEYIGTFVDDGKYYKPSEDFYPTLVFGKDYKLRFETNPDINRLIHYQAHDFFAIGVPWSLIKNGKIDYTHPYSTITKTLGGLNTSNQPRTLVGQRADGYIVWVAVEGRRLTSPGLKADGCANLMLSLGCVIAANMDGGGSTEMIVNGVIKNALSDGSERAIGTAFVAYRKVAKVECGPSPYPQVKTTAALRVRSGASTSTVTLATIPVNTTVSASGYQNGWYRVSYNGVTGYVSGDYVVGVGTLTNTTKRGVVTSTSGLNIRNGATVSATRVGALSYNTTITIYDQKQGFYKISNTAEQWVSADFIRLI